MSRVPGGDPRDIPGDDQFGEDGASPARSWADGAHRDGGGESVSPKDECLVWVPGAQEPPSDLVQSLSRRGVKVRVRRDAMSVMAAACRMSSQCGREGFVIVFCQPSQLLGSGDVFRAMEKFAPRGRVWVYRRVRDEGELTSATRDEAASWPTLESARLPIRVEPPVPDRRVAPLGVSDAGARGAAGSAGAASSGRPRLRLTGEQSELDQLLRHSKRAPGYEALDAEMNDAPEPLRNEVLSAEELRMLLRDLGPDDDRDRRDRGDPTGGAP
ncbi:MAG: hypothetical protein K2X32_14575 [Phycisphaerales bacterium]|nr:hypothetical protein [Phycisphaerales bacterium]